MTGKRIACLALTCLMTASLCACGINKPHQTEPTMSDEQINATAPVLSDELSVSEYEVANGYDVLLEDYTTNILINTAGEYAISGASNDKMIFIDSNEDITLILDNVEMTSSVGPCIYIKNASAATIKSKKDSVNRLTSTGNSSYEALNATIYALVDLGFDGDGTIEVCCSHSHAIKSTMSLGILGGIYNLDAVKNCLDAQETVFVEGGELTLKSSSGDGIESERDVIIYGGNFTIDVASDGIKAKNNLEIIDGKFDIKACEGIESKDALVINGGTFMINTSDDCINAIGVLTINGGNIIAISETNDAIDGNEGIVINDGHIYAVGTTEREGAFDCDDSDLVINGGAIIGVGETNSETILGDQCALVINFNKTEQIKTIELRDQDENVVYSCEINEYTMMSVDDADDSGNDSKGESGHFGDKNGRNENNNDIEDGNVVGADSMLYVSILISDKKIQHGEYLLYINGELYKKIAI